MGFIINQSNTIRTSSSGRSHALHALHTFSLVPFFSTNSESSGFDIEKCKHVFDKLVEDIKVIFVSL